MSLPLLPCVSLTPNVQLITEIQIAIMVTLYDVYGDESFAQTVKGPVYWNSLIKAFSLHSLLGVHMRRVGRIAWVTPLTLRTRLEPSCGY